MHKAWYGSFQINRICKNNHVEIKDHTRWLAKVPIEEVVHLRDYWWGKSASAWFTDVVIKDDRSGRELWIQLTFNND